MFAATVSETAGWRRDVYCTYMCVYIYIYICLSSSLLYQAAVAQAQNGLCEGLNMKTKHVHAYAVTCFDLYIQQQTPVTRNTVMETTC